MSDTLRSLFERSQPSALDVRRALLDVGPEHAALVEQPWFDMPALLDLARRLDVPFATPETARLAEYCEHL